jgi:hypothetical protein
MERGLLEFYQATQNSRVFDRCKGERCERIVCCIGHGGSKARFIGVWKVGERRDGRNVQVPDGFPPELGPCRWFYVLERETGYEDLEKRVVIEWGKGGRFVKNLANQEVRELLPEGDKLPLPNDYLNFTLSHAKLRRLYRHQEANREWRALLRAVAGIYLILATTTGQQYVGSAYGTEGIWGRWAAYARNGHGGNTLLNDLIRNANAYPGAFSYSILQVLPSSSTRGAVLERERLYKEKLGSRATGLNT